MNVLAVTPDAKVKVVGPTPAPELPEDIVLVNFVPLFTATVPVKSPAGMVPDAAGFEPPEYPEPLTDAVTVPDEPNPCGPLYS